MPKVAAVVVIYNPELSVVANINSYIEQVGKLFVVDNSDKVINENLFQELSALKNAEYISNKGNLGIAAALNIGATRAIEEDFEYLLTMDQDSEATPSMVSALMECFSQDFKIGIVSPILYHPEGRNIIHKSEKSFERIITAWTSGNLLDLDVFKKSGGFKEDLFIDYVDHEFCLRLNRMGFKVYVCNKARLKHSLGNIEEVNLIFRKFYPTNHSALRLYYRTRNRFYVKKKYKSDLPEFFKQDNKDFWRTFLKIVLFEKARVKKMKFMLKGYCDFRKNIFGRYEGPLREILIVFFLLSYC